MAVGRLDKGSRVGSSSSPLVSLLPPPTSSPSPTRSILGHPSPPHHSSPQSTLRLSPHIQQAGLSAVSLEPSSPPPPVFTRPSSLSFTFPPSPLLACSLFVVRCLLYAEILVIRASLHPFSLPSLPSSLSVPSTPRRALDLPSSPFVRPFAPSFHPRPFTFQDGHQEQA